MSNPIFNNNNLSEFQVIVDKPIWLGSRIWEPKVYDNPPAILLRCAEKVVDNADSPIYFGINGVKVNPFAKFEVLNLDDTDVDDEESDDEDEDVNVDDDDEVAEDDNDEESDEETETDDKAVEDDSSDSDDDSVESEYVDFEFKNEKQFVSLNKKSQLKYIEKIIENSDFYEGAQGVEYVRALGNVLSFYHETSKHDEVKTFLAEALREFEDEDDD